MRSRLLDIYLEKRIVCTDTRKIQEGAIFFALKGENFDGNKFAEKALEDGCSYAVIDNHEYQKSDRFILVDDVLSSLQQLATQYRLTTKAKYLAITGSNGKTTSKELIRDVLLKKFKVQATKGNFNNHIGVPLTLLEIQDDTEIAIIEMGANHQKEIASYCEIAMPDMGFITNIGKAHLEGFGGIEGVKKGKGELFDFIRKNSGKVFVNLDSKYLEEMSKGIERVTFNSEGGPYNLKVTQTVPKLSLEFEIDDNKHRCDSHMTGLYNIHNMAAAIAIGDYFGVDGKSICEALSNYIPDNNRSQLHKTADNTLILDAYNANPSSLSEALINLSKMESDEKFFIIGDMLELGEYSEKEHLEILNLASQLGMNGFTVGNEFMNINTKENIKSFRDNSGVIEYLNQKPLKDKTVLIKGSRGIKLEELVKFL